jgi:hypothetical protein
VALDNIWIGNRQRTVLVERFNNVGRTNTYTLPTSNDWAIIEYHTSFPSTDSINLANPSDNNARSLYYEIDPDLVPVYLLNGNNPYLESASSSFKSALSLKTLTDPDFDLKLDLIRTNNNLEVKASITSLSALGQKELSLRIAVVAKKRTVNSKTYYNVLKAMLPNAAGTLFNQYWDEGTSTEASYNYTLGSSSDFSNLAVIAFIQEEGTLSTSTDIGQATYADVANTVLGITDHSAVTTEQICTVWPNPSNGQFTLSFGEGLGSETRLEVFNQFGSLVYTEDIAKNTEQSALDLSKSPSGVYFLRLVENGKVVFTEKLVILQ